MIARIRVDGVWLGDAKALLLSSLRRRRRFRRGRSFTSSQLPLPQGSLDGFVHGGPVADPCNSQRERNAVLWMDQAKDDR